MFNFLRKKTKATEYVDYEEITENVVEAEPMYQSSTPLTPATVQEFGNNVATTVDNALDIVSLVTTSVTDTIQIVANVKLEIAQLDHDLDKFLADSNMRLERFKSAMPVLEKQLNKISDRIDSITDKMLTNVMDAKDTDSIKKHELMMDMLNGANDSFNNMLCKLISL